MDFFADQNLAPAHFCRQTLRTCMLAVCALVATHAQAQATQEAFHPLDSAALVGKWQVAAVFANQYAEKETEIGTIPDQPTYVGRSVLIDPTSIAIPLLHLSCAAPATFTERQSIRQLVQRSMRLWTRNLGLREYMPATIWGDEEAQTDVFWMQCSAGNLESGFDGEVSSLPGSHFWIAPLNDGRLLMSWGMNAILMLERVSDAARPTPSFDCARAASAADRAICASFDLAGYDRAIAHTYAWMSDKLTSDELYANPQTLAGLRKLQRLAHARTEACGSNSGCLLHSLQKNAQELTRFWQTPH